MKTLEFLQKRPKLVFYTRFDYPAIMSNHPDTDMLPAFIEPITNTLGMGKAMRAINPKQRAFVRAFVLTGGTNATRACAMSGYGETEESRKSTAYRLTHDQKILAAIREAADSMIRASILVGANVLTEIAQTPHHKDRFKAAEALLNRGGLIVAAQHNVNLTVTEDTPNNQVIDRIKVLSAQLGIDPRVLLGRAVSSSGASTPGLPNPLVIDAEFEEVAVPTAEGLEDLL